MLEKHNSQGRGGRGKRNNRKRKKRKIEGKEETKEPEQRKRNMEYRQDTNTPTIMSYIEKAKLCDIYRGKTTMSAAYLNEKEESELKLA